MTEKKSKYVGLWINNDKNGNVYLGGKDRDTNIKYFVFTDGKDPTVKKLYRTEEGKELEVIGTVTKKSNDNGEFMICENHIIVENRYYEEGTKKPQYQIKLPD